MIRSGVRGKVAASEFQFLAVGCSSTAHTFGHGDQHLSNTTAGMDRHLRVADRASNTTDSLVRRSDRSPFGGRDLSQRIRFLLEIDAATPTLRLYDEKRHRDGGRKAGATPVPAGL